MPIDHIIVVFFENHTFDNLYGLFPGANGLAQAGAAIPQVDLDGEVYPTLPQPADPEATPPGPDAPSDIVAEPVFDAEGILTGLTKDGEVTPDATP